MQIDLKISNNLNSRFVAKARFEVVQSAMFTSAAAAAASSFAAITLPNHEELRAVLMIDVERMIAEKT
jgi:hypothetical protein